MAKTTTPASAANSLRDAATVILLRPAPTNAAGFVTYMVQRPSRSRFMPGAFVFPGGRVEAGETVAQAAVRETHEESNVTITESDLVLWSRWVTPDVEPRRYDARFYLARVPMDTQATPDPVETVGGLWTQAGDMLRRAQAGEAFLAPPTQRCLELLDHYNNVDELLRNATQSSPPTIKPVVVQEGEHTFVALPGDSAHPEPDALLPGDTRIAVPRAWLEQLQARAKTPTV